MGGLAVSNHLSFIIIEVHIKVLNITTKAKFLVGPKTIVHRLDELLRPLVMVGLP